MRRLQRSENFDGNEIIVLKILDDVVCWGSFSSGITSMSDWQLLEPSVETGFV